ncbi:PE-PGRS family protein [Streptomyces sp. NBC_01387]|uniref:PE-PGRS family protein n=1 Tax=unclassified Streptomyces TaxID=2593676 RepID=UPI00224CB6C1|nr:MULTISPECIES: PE-PGRS family protein [unclassified Streptomyces]MCX4549023.1 PE-PGRS family protein [Streptomyces sp. NBC_01500]
MRMVNPDDLDQLAKLMDGKGGVQDKVDEAFTRASQLGVTSHLTSLKPLRSWVSDTAPDLRKRAGIARLESGDPEAGARWAGFTPKELDKYLKDHKGQGLTPDEILLANSIAASKDPKADTFKRQSNESLNDWISRIKADALSQIPGLEPHAATIVSIMDLYGDWKSVKGTAATVTMQGGALTKVLVGNALKSNVLVPWKNRIGTVLAGRNNSLLKWAGGKVIAYTPTIRSLGAPGSWFPSKLGQWAQKIPGTRGLVGDMTGEAYDAVRGLSFMDSPIWRGVTVNKAINFLVGSDELAAKYGGVTHAGTLVARAGNADLLRVARSAAYFQKAANARPAVIAAGRTASPLLKGLGAAGKTAGFLRGAGIVGSVAATGFSAANVWAQGNPIDAFKRKGAGYVADVAEVGFNASMTAAMIAPNPVTIGLAVGTGIIYGGAKIVEHWDDIKKGAGKAADWVGDKASKVGSGIAHGAKSLAKKANPMHWF